MMSAAKAFKGSAEPNARPSMRYDVRATDTFVSTKSVVNIAQMQRYALRTTGFIGWTVNEKSFLFSSSL